MLMNWKPHIIPKWIYALNIIQIKIPLEDDLKHFMENQKN